MCNHNTVLIVLLLLLRGYIFHISATRRRRACATVENHVPVGPIKEPRRQATLSATTGSRQSGTRPIQWAECTHFGCSGSSVQRGPARSRGPIYFRRIKLDSINLGRYLIPRYAGIVSFYIDLLRAQQLLLPNGEVEKNCVHLLYTHQVAEFRPETSWSVPLCGKAFFIHRRFVLVPFCQLSQPLHALTRRRCHRICPKHAVSALSDMFVPPYGTCRS